MKASNTKVSDKRADLEEFKAQLASEVANQFQKLIKIRNNNSKDIALVFDEIALVTRDGNLASDCRTMANGSLGNSTRELDAHDPVQEALVGALMATVDQVGRNPKIKKNAVVNIIVRGVPKAERERINSELPNTFTNTDKRAAADTVAFLLAGSTQSDPEKTIKRNYAQYLNRIEDKFAQPQYCGIVPRKIASIDPRAMSGGFAKLVESKKEQAEANRTNDLLNSLPKVPTGFGRS